MRRGCWMMLALFCALVGELDAGRAPAGAAPRRRAVKRHDRPVAEAPAPRWTADVLEVFFPDARLKLGPRSTAPTAPRPMPAAPITGGAVATAASGNANVPWAKLISAGTLEDEIKQLVARAAADVQTVGHFKSDGFRTARTDYSVLAALFGVIAQYPGDVRWKGESAGLRDLFTRAGRNCKAASDATYREAKARSDDLAELVRGGQVELPEGESPAAWPEVVDRRPLMARLEEGQEARLDPWTASEQEFRRHQEEIGREAQVLSVLAEIIKEPGYEYADDGTYQRHADAFEQHCRELFEAARDANFEKARSSLGDLKQSCDGCHQDFRS